MREENEVGNFRRLRPQHRLFLYFEKKINRVPISVSFRFMIFRIYLKSYYHKGHEFGSEDSQNSHENIAVCLIGPRNVEENNRSSYIMRVY